MGTIRKKTEQKSTMKGLLLMAGAAWASQASQVEMGIFNTLNEIRVKPSRFIDSKQLKRRTTHRLSWSDKLARIANELCKNTDSIVTKEVMKSHLEASIVTNTQNPKKILKELLRE